MHSVGLFGPDDLMDVRAMDFEHFRDHLETRAATLAPTPVIAMLPAGALRGTVTKRSADLAAAMPSHGRQLLCATFAP